MKMDINRFKCIYKPFCIPKVHIYIKMLKKKPNQFDFCFSALEQIIVMTQHDKYNLEFSSS